MRIPSNTSYGNRPNRDGIHKLPPLSQLEGRVGLVELIQELFTVCRAATFAQTTPSSLHSKSRLRSRRSDRLELSLAPCLNSNSRYFWVHDPRSGHNHRYDALIDMEKLVFLSWEIRVFLWRQGGGGTGSASSDFLRWGHFIVPWWTRTYVMRLTGTIRNKVRFIYIASGREMPIGTALVVSGLCYFRWGV
ncbi:hypothetical protein AVEN_268077-1 [Araneus ventricosus]|uniref:Uncharacterized protein n=1 Tax=Araneus ventricosus TaxID=182803 RepID=A0A4Y2KM85_ARAVE|nr:hypothetical protein AVEN_268077-1 [Araneus ventricosus]